MQRRAETPARRIGRRRMHTPQDPLARPSDEGGSATDADGPRRNGSAAPGVRAAAVGTKLKSIFAELTSGPMPDHLLALMDQLESSLDDEPTPGPKPARNGR